MKIYFIFVLLVTALAQVPWVGDYVPAPNTNFGSCCVPTSINITYTDPINSPAQYIVIYNFPSEQSNTWCEAANITGVVVDQVPASSSGISNITFVDTINPLHVFTYAMVNVSNSTNVLDIVTYVFLISANYSAGEFCNFTIINSANNNSNSTARLWVGDYFPSSSIEDSSCCIPSSVSISKSTAINGALHNLVTYNYDSSVEDDIWCSVAGIYGTFTDAVPSQSFSNNSFVDAWTKQHTFSWNAQVGDTIDVALWSSDSSSNTLESVCSFTLFKGAMKITLGVFVVFGGVMAMSL